MSRQIKWRKQYDPKRDEIARENTVIQHMDESLTIQDAPDSDINVLMERFGIKDGSQIPANMGVIDPRFYGDFSDIPDLREALDRTAEAKFQFMRLPAKLRSKFNNDPLELYDWVNKPENIDEAVEIGLLHREARKLPDNKDNLPPNPNLTQT